MAAIEKRTTSDGSTSYRVKIRLRGQPVQSATFASLTKAKQWAVNTEAAIREGRYFQTAEAKRHTLAEAIERYERERLGDMRAKEARKQHLGYWRAELGTLPLSDVTPAAVKQKLAQLADNPSERTGKPLSASTLNHYRQALASVLTEAVKNWEWLEASPMHKVGKKAEPRGRVRYLSDDERARLLETCKQSSNPDLYLAILLALTTGGRQAETMGATWAQIDLNRATLQLEETKNGSRRALHLTAPVLELLKERAKVRRIDSGLLFPSKVNPKQAVDLRQPWEKALQAAGIEGFHWHDMRHDFASMAAMNGASLPELAALLGHKTLAMVQRYAHLSPAHTATLAEKVAARMVGGGAA
ncbi:tyrosine-type recombinase/integrase [Acidithiobacillus sulfurivorans]|uniref:Site-specific integrase n=1 Tax=Acidithiobacillus sulfurivorans TaxID=1958756 RepID=A0ABS5ZZG6_9PROT|nr:site-specific integrase [Acidithiobacillus sulfurivorans]MBU2760585.1 site-specific integrase [Acidithiobacillus sulfurivorans]